MSASTIAKVYAEALFLLATEGGRREALDAELVELRQVFRDHPEIRRFFESPRIPKEEKLQVIESSFRPNLDRVTTGFLVLLVRKGREVHLDRILEAYEALVDEAEGRIQVKVTSAAPLPDDTTTRLADEITRITGEKVELEAAVDKRLIGGLTIRVGDRLLDASLYSRLRRLREQALQG